MTGKDAPILLVPFDPQWVRRFGEERTALESVLRPWLAGPIEHIGSTAVPGLAAKPVIDIMAPVETLPGSRDAIVALQDLSYVYFPYRTDVMHWFCKPHHALRTHHLHLVPHRSALWTERIAFRDRLRADSLVAAEYVALKRSLAETFAHDREAYTEGKSEFVARVVGETLRQKATP